MKVERYSTIENLNKANMKNPLVEIPKNLKEEGIFPSDKEIKNRLESLPKFKQNIESSYLRRYSKLVTSANTGAILKSN